MKENDGLMSDKRFKPLFWTQFFGAFNDNVFKNALVILITYKSYQLLNCTPEQMVALCGGIFILPFFLFSAFAGQVADKWEKHRLIFLIKVWEVIVMLLGTAGFIFDQISVLLASLFLMGLQSTFFGPVKYSILPELVEEDELVEGNSLIEMGTFVAILLGTILGGVLMGIEKQGALLVSFTVLTLAAIGCYFSRKVQPLEAKDANLKIEIGIIRPTWNILKLCTEVKGVWNSILAISWFWFLGAALLSIFPVYVKNIIHADQYVTTLFLALFSIGVAVGSIVCEKLSKGGLELGLVPFGAFGISLFIFDLYLIGEGSYPTAQAQALSISDFVSIPLSFRIMADLFLFSLFSGLFIVPLYTYMQQFSRSDVRSRVIAGNNILNALFMVCSSLLLTFFYSQGLTVVDMYLIFAVMNLVIAIYIFTVVPEFFLRFLIMVLGKIIYRTKVKGLENIPKEGAAVLVCNHVSFVDWLIISALIKRPIRFVMHYTFMKIPLLKYFFKAGKVIPIAGFKEDKEILHKSFELISNELREGELVCLFPEGQITKTGELNTYRKGIEKIIEKDDVPVIPMTLTGLWGSFFSRKYGSAASKPMAILKSFRRKLLLSIDPQIEASKVSAEHLEEITLQMLQQESPIPK